VVVNLLRARYHVGNPMILISAIRDGVQHFTINGTYD